VYGGKPEPAPRAGTVTLLSYESLRRLREHQPVHFDAASQTWLLTRHRDCVAALRDPRFSAALGQGRRRRADSMPTSMLNTDPPAHRRLRAPAARALTRARLQRCGDQAAAIAGHYAERFARAGTGDAIAGYAAPVAAATLAALLGVPSPELPRFARLAGAAAVNLDPLADAATAAEGRRAGTELADYLRALVREDRMTPDGVIAALTGNGAGAPGAEPPSSEETLATLVLLVVGGFEPLVHVIGNGLDTLLRRPAQVSHLRSAPQLWPTAVDELLRWESPIPFTARVCTADAVIGGRRIRPGETVVALLAAGNRDPEAFAGAETVDIARSPNPMLAFGAGVHTCLAAPAVRLVARIALATVVDRLPRMTLAEEPAAWRDSVVPRGLTRLPVRVQ
jgi:cytochrome P450